MGSSCSASKGGGKKNVILDGLQDHGEVWTCASETLEEAGYETLEKLGAGQWGAVFLVKNVRTGDLAAAKKIPKITRITWDGVQVAPKANRLSSEVAALIKLGGRHNCVKLLGLLESTQTITLVMENLAGGDVLHHIEKVSLYRESDASALVRQLVSALAHCRAQGVVHRDVKPANMLLSADNSFKLCDFGSACLWSPPPLSEAVAATAAEVASQHVMPRFNWVAKDSLNEQGLMVGEHGSPFYGAPEVQTRRGGYNHKIDIFSAGISLYVMVIGFPKDPEFFWTMIYENRGVRTLPKNGQTGLSDEFWNLLGVMIAFDPSDRPEAEHLLQHSPWLQQGASDDYGNSDDEAALDTSVHAHYNKLRRLTRSTIFLIMSMLSEKDLTTLTTRLEEQEDHQTPPGSPRRNSVGSTKHTLSLSKVIDALESLRKSHVVTALESVIEAVNVSKSAVVELGDLFRDAEPSSGRARNRGKRSGALGSLEVQRRDKNADNRLSVLTSPRWTKTFKDTQDWNMNRANRDQALRPSAIAHSASAASWSALHAPPPPPPPPQQQQQQQQYGRMKRGQSNPDISVLNSISELSESPAPTVDERFMDLSLDGKVRI